MFRRGLVVLVLVCACVRGGLGQTRATVPGDSGHTQQTNPASDQGKSDSPRTGSSKSTQRYDDNDSVVNTFKPIDLQCPGNHCESLANDAAVNEYPEDLRKGGIDFWSLLEAYSTGSWPADEKSCKDISNRAIIVHFAIWRVDLNANSIKGLAYSKWQGYRASWDSTSKVCSVKQPRSADNSPLFFKTNQAKLIAIDLFQSKVDTASANIVYKVSTTPTVPQNVQDLGTLIETLSGAAGTKGRAALPKPPLLNGCLTIADIDTTSSPPYTINVAVTAGKTAKNDSGDSNGKASSKSPGDPVDCTDASTKGCSFSRQFAVTEPESWDVGVGLAIPGVTEAVYSPPTAGSAPKSTLKHHTDAYALVDLYPFGWIAPKYSYWPHVNFGIPVTSQSLHRPYFGLGEDISGWAQRKGFPLDICIFGGLVDMKQQVYSSTGQLKWDRALRGVVGLEMPVGQLASKLGKSKSKSDSGSKTDSSSSQ